MKSKPTYWQTKQFATLDAMKAWIDKHGNETQWHELFINNAYGVEYRYLRIL